MNVPQPEDQTLKMLASAAFAVGGLFVGTRVIFFGARGMAAVGGPIGVAALGVGGGPPSYFPYQLVDYSVYLSQQCT